MSGAGERRTFLMGMLGGVTLGGGAGFFAGRQAGFFAGHRAGFLSGRDASHVSGHEAPSPPEPGPGKSWFALPQDMAFARPSFAQQGEDLVVAEILLEELRNKRPTYVDIGAYDPIASNNTYLLYRQGFRGVLVEPNPKYAAKLREARPGDVVVEAGIGDNEQDTRADYYVIKGDDQLNTFSKEQADSLSRFFRRNVVERVLKVPLIHVNKLLEAHFPTGGPDFFSVDTEGFDYTILKGLDFERFRPQVICAETAILSFIQEKLIDLVKGKDYEVRGGSYLNTVFLDRRLRNKAGHERGDGGRDG